MDSFVDMAALADLLKGPEEDEKKNAFSRPPATQPALTPATLISSGERSY